MKADSTMVVLGLFAIIVGAMMMYLLIPKIAAPSMKIHGDEQGYIIAKTMASSINALSYADEGEITKSFEAEWDVHVRCDTDTCSIKVFFENKGSHNVGTVVVTSNVEPFTGDNVERIKITKNNDGKVKLEDISKNE